MSSLVKIARRILSPPALQRGALLRGESWLADTGALSPVYVHGETDALVSTAHSAIQASKLDGDAVRAALIDITGLTQIDAGAAELSQSFLQVQRVVQNLAPAHSRVVLHSSSPTSEQRSTAIAGFTKSLARELGLRGGTANAVLGDTADAVALQRWLLSPESAFTSGQVFRVRAPVQHAIHSNVTPQHAVVTGGAQGIGAAIVRGLAAHGYTVTVIDVDADAAAALAAEVNGEHLHADLASAAAQQTVRDCIAGMNTNVVVHNVGITRDKVLKRGREADIHAVLDVNLRSILQLDAAIGTTGSQERLTAHGASVLYMSSINGLAGAAGQTGYAYTKGALIDYMHQHAAGAAKRGLRLNVLAPGFIETAMTDKLPPLPALLGQFLAAVQHRGVPEDVAAAALALANPSSAGVWGNVVRVCGGNLAGS